jgi:hypothetical protein
MQARDALAALDTAAEMMSLGRHARGAELMERAVAALDADTALPSDSLLRVLALSGAGMARVANTQMSLMREQRQQTSDDAASGAARTAAWRAEPRALAHSQRALALLLARSDAGTLFAPLTPVERASQLNANEEEEGVTGDDDDDAAKLGRMQLYIGVAVEAVRYWPPLSDPAAEEARVRGVAGALRALCAASTRDGARQPGVLLTNMGSHLSVAVVRQALSEDAATGGLLLQLRATCGLTREEEATLREEVLPLLLRGMKSFEDDVAARTQLLHRRAAADLARHGLRACALPGCSATEPQPKVFKICSRCRRACYCSQAHQQQDWRRHKREDACAAAPQ